MGRAYELDHRETGETATGNVVFHANPNAQGWGELVQQVDKLLDRGVLQWEFDIQNMRFCDSHGLGMWLKINTRIRDAEGRASYLVREPSRVLDLFRLTKLDQVLDLRIGRAGES